ncbi:MAG: hypothetical protein J1F38_04755 [Muribaculaceae bacterium]|nr:hypothetical protein [Muribaculaceae bacterium]
MGKMCKTAKILTLVILLFHGVARGESAGLSITARLDSVNVLMGNLNTLHLEIVENEGDKGRLSIFRDLDRARGYATVCGDSVELDANYKIDTTRLGSGRMQLNYSIPVQSFDSGTYTLPRFVYYVGQDSALSNSLTFNVYPVNVTADDQIAPLAQVSEPDGKRFYDWVPDWILDFWWLWLIIFLAICIFLYGMKNYQKKGIPFIAPKETPKPWVIALDSLQRLKNRKLWEQGMEKEYFTDLTDILRVYLVDRFGINAMEMTTRQIMDKIYESDLRDKRDYVKQILNVADFVKFAKVRPLPADSIAAYENAVKFVEETVPVEKVEEKTATEKEGGENI